MRFFANRRGIELAASTMVLLVVAAIILTLSTTLAYRSFCGAEEFSQEIDARTQNRVEQLLTGGAAVEVADNTKTAERTGSAICGSSNQYSVTFTLGIKNGPFSEITRYLSVYQELDDGTRIACPESECQYFTDTDANDIRLEAGEVHLMKILITPQPPFETSQRVYTFAVRDGENEATSTLYGVQQVYVDLPIN